MIKDARMATLRSALWRAIALTLADPRVKPIDHDRIIQAAKMVEFVLSPEIRSLIHRLEDTNAD